MITTTPVVRQLVIDFQRVGGPHIIARGQLEVDEDGEITLGPLKEPRRPVGNVAEVQAVLAWTLTKLKQHFNRDDIIYMTPPEPEEP